MSRLSEQDAIARIVELTRAKYLRDHADGQPALRCQHAKSHGCVTATFVVGQAPPDLAYGLFARPGTYPAWVRFSSSSPVPQSDSLRDAHAIAIKVVGIPDIDAQDFILATGHAFLCANASDYVDLMEHGLPRFFAPAPLRPRELANMLSATHRWPWSLPPTNPLRLTYHSQTPYALGSPQMHAVKYAARPARIRNVASVIGPNLLRDAMAFDLCAGAATYEFQVQTQPPGADVDDATVRWRTPLRTVATLHIPPQNFTTRQRTSFAERLSYSPAHAMPEHHPLGSINRVRAAVYAELAALRGAS